LKNCFSGGNIFQESFYARTKKILKCLICFINILIVKYYLTGCVLDIKPHKKIRLCISNTKVETQTILSYIAQIDEIVKSLEIVMPDLIRHPERIEFTGFRLSPE